MKTIIKAENICKTFGSGDAECKALDDISLEIKEGEFVSIVGRSGSGKSTFLNMIGGLDRPSAGSLLVDGKNLFTMGERELVCYKRDTVGFVWQNNARNLLPYLSALENIMLPMHISGQKKKKEKALELLEQVGMTAKRNNRLNTMSGGEQQRIAIAIALANNPKLLLADEPTGSVDTKTADIIFDIFRELNRNGQTILIVTHDIALSKKVRRVVAIRDGKISSERILKEKYADRLKELTVDWRNEDTQEEYAVIDKAGRVQIPRELWDKLALRDNKVKLELRGDEILLSRPAEDENRNM